MRNARLDEAQAGIKIAGRNIKNLRYADDTTLMAESKEELKSLLMKVKEESEKPGLKLNLRKTKIMASGQSHHFMANRWGKKWKQRQILFSWAPKSLQMVTAAMKLEDACSLDKKATTNLDSILKSSNITLLTKVNVIKSVVFPGVMHRRESWTMKTAEC